ncbi:MAG: hypothetical protein HKN16_05710 [Saprospiraceae bacterium]|nr:hypothetical protein [Saprospiraceae bacterium]
MKWILSLLFSLLGVMAFCQEFSFGVAGLYNLKSNYIETKEKETNSVVHLGFPDMDSVYYLTLLETITEREYTVKGKPGFQAEANVDWKLGDRWSVGTGLGMRYRNWEYEDRVKIFIFYETLLNEIPEEEAPDFTPTLFCDEVINLNPGQIPNPVVDVRSLDLFIPVQFNVAFNEQFDAGVSFLFSAPVLTKLEYETTHTEYSMDGGLQICENSIRTREDDSGDDFRGFRFSSELQFTYWLQNIGIQLFGQLTSTPLFEKIETAGPNLGGVINTDSFKPRFIGLKVKYRLGEKANPE